MLNYGPQHRKIWEDPLQSWFVFKSEICSRICAVVNVDYENPFGHDTLNDSILQLSKLIDVTQATAEHCPAKILIMQWHEEN